VYVFGQSGTTWSQAQKLAPPDPTGGDFFGWSVALNGSTAIVGAHEHTGPFATGAAYVFTNGGTTWSPTPQELVAPSGAQYFGYSVAVSGTAAMIGAIGQSNESGAVYPFTSAALPAPALGRGAALPVLMALLGALGWLASRPRRGVIES
jgi:hypothetical protein